MDDKVRKHVTQFCEARGWGQDDATVIEAIHEGEPVHREEVGHARWWNEYLYVVEIDGMFIGYKDAETTGDMSAHEVGYKFDATTICEMQAIEKTVVVYEPAGVESED